MAYLRVALSQTTSLDPTERQDVDLLLGVFSGVIATTPAEYPQMALKEREVTYAAKRQKDYKLADGCSFGRTARSSGG